MSAVHAPPPTQGGTPPAKSVYPRTQTRRVPLKFTAKLRRSRPEPVAETSLSRILTNPLMTPFDIALVAGAGLAAGTINTIVGSGSLITFPTLLALGFPPVVANVSNTVGLVPGSLSGVVGYRRELAGQSGRVLRLGVASVLGGFTGAALLLVLPETAFEQIVPFLILGACLLVALQNRLSAAVRRRRPAGAGPGPLLFVLVYATGIYGGYFGAAQGVILMAILPIFVADELQRLNGLKNVLALLVNSVAAAFFIVMAPVAWDAAVVLALGAVVGGQFGAYVGRRLSPTVLRTAILVVGTSVAVAMLVR